MEFNSINKCLPDVGTQVLIKIKKNDCDNIRYYVCDVELHYNSKGEVIAFTEACGEQYCCWDIDEVEGWMYTNELDLIEVD